METFYFNLKGSYDDAKNNIIWCIWCNAMYCVYGKKKKHIIFHIPYIIVAPLCPTFLKSVDFLQSVVCSDWPAIQCFVIGRIPQVCDGNVTPLTIFGNAQHLHDMAAAVATTILQRE